MLWLILNNILVIVVVFADDVLLWISFYRGAIGMLLLLLLQQHLLLLFRLQLQRSFCGDTLSFQWESRLNTVRVDLSRWMSGAAFSAISLDKRLLLHIVGKSCVILLLGAIVLTHNVSSDCCPFFLMKLIVVHTIIKRYMRSIKLTLMLLI